MRVRIDALRHRSSCKAELAPDCACHLHAQPLIRSDKLELNGTRLTFKGDTAKQAGNLEHRHYAFDLELFAEASIKGEPHLIGKSLSVVLQKKGSSLPRGSADSLQRRRRARWAHHTCLTGTDYWPRLTKEKVRRPSPVVAHLSAGELRENRRV